MSVFQSTGFILVEKRYPLTNQELEQFRENMELSHMLCYAIIQLGEAIKANYEGNNEYDLYDHYFDNGGSRIFPERVFVGTREECEAYTKDKPSFGRTRFVIVSRNYPDREEEKAIK